MAPTSTRKRLTRILPQAFLGLTLAAAAADAGAPAPTFTKVFTPDTIGPGSVSTLTFTVTNNDGASPLADMAFTDTLPAGVTLADPANASTDCLDAVLSAPDGGSTVSFSDGELGASATCTVAVDVTSSTPGTHMNTSSVLSSSTQPDSGTASDDLTVVTTLPGFSKSFAPSTVPLGGRSTLTLTIDNTANASKVDNLDFTDTLPAGMQIADPANAATDCGTAVIPPTLTATAGTSVVVLDANGIGSFPALAAGATCTVDVDVTATGGGLLDNVTGDLLAQFVAAGKASATLEVTVTDLALQKSFTDDPVPPGGTVTLDFRIDNFDRFDPATGVAFTDALPAGVMYSSLLSNDCGGSVTGVGTTTIGFSGGTVPMEGFCTVSTSLTVPSGVTPGAYTNTTGAVSGTVGGSPVMGNTASDVLFVEPAPVLTKLFVGDPVGAGDTVTLRFTVTNTSLTSGATDIELVDELTDGGGGFPPDPTSGFLPFPVSVTLPPVPDPPCGAGSSLALVSVGIDRQGLELTGGSLAAAGMAGDSCTFDVTVTIPAGFPAGTYLNTTEEITATVDGATRTGAPASDDLVVVAAPTLAKAFTDDPVDPGDTVTLQFILTHDAFAAGDATGVMFTDDLNAVITGLAAAAGQLPMAGLCPAGNGTLAGSAGDTLLTFSGATLAPGEVCIFSVTLDVPGAATAGDHANTTSGVTATVLGTLATENAASDDLRISGLVLTKEFLGDPVIPGDAVTLRFTLDNTHPTLDATAIQFTDSLSAALSGLVAEAPLPVAPCDGTITGTGFLVFSGGSVNSGAAPCSFDVTVRVPAGADDGTYVNVTSAVSSSLGIFDAATDALTVDSNLLSLAKEFTDDPVAPGDSVTLEFTLLNLDNGQAASDVDFTDDLGATLAGLTFDSVVLNDCGATVSGQSTTAITVADAALGVGGACTIRLSLTVPGGAAANVYTNTTSAVTGLVGGFAVDGDAASDDLEVREQLLFSKSFDGPATAGGAAVLSFTITNPNATAVADLIFSDDLDDVVPGLVATSLPADPCGTGSQLTGTSFLAFTGGSLPPSGGMCSFDVDVSIPATAPAGTFPNTTSELFQFGLPLAAPATADLTILDTTPPAVTAVATAAGTLATCDSVTLPLDSMLVTIADDHSPIEGAGDPANYLLVAAGPDGDFDTGVCGGAAGDDVPVEIFSLSLASIDPVTVEASPQFGAALAPGLYRLLVCDTIQDGVGNRLDGDGDGNAGGDFVLPFFRADPFNLFANGHFDDCPVTLDPWIVVATSPNTVAPGATGTDDSDASPLSASARSSHSSADASALAQCVPVTGGLTYDLRARFRFVPALGASASFDETCEFFDDAVCAGASLGTSSIATAVGDAGGIWIAVDSPVGAPAGAASALCDFAVQAVGADTDFDFFLDGLFLGNPDALIFTDGFESGDTSAWTSAVP